jgi:hypothetical protein
MVMPSSTLPVEEALPNDRVIRDIGAGGVCDGLEWPLDIGAAWAYSFLLRLCISWWLIDRFGKYKNSPDGDRGRAAYVMVWLAILGALWFASPTNGTCMAIFGAIASIRWLEIATTCLGLVLDRREPVRARRLITIAIYALQIVLIFAILDHSWVALEFTMADGHTHATQIFDRFDYLYMSWTDMTTLGNNFIPLSKLAGFFQFATTTSGILLLGVVAARAISASESG